MAKTTDYEIVSDLPVPPAWDISQLRKLKEDKYPFAKLEIGQCLVLPYKSAKDIVRFRAAAGSYAKRLDRKFVTRVLPDNKFGVWRVAKD